MRRSGNCFIIFKYFNKIFYNNIVKFFLIFNNILSYFYYNFFKSVSILIFYLFFIYIFNIYKKRIKRKKVLFIDIIEIFLL